VMLTSTGMPNLDPPANLAVAENGLFTWDAPGGGDTMASLSPATGEKVFADVIDHNVNSSRDLESYNVFLGSSLQGNTTETEWLFENLVYNQTYTAGVQAVYDDGESDIVTIEFTYMVTNADNDIIAKTELYGNYPNPFNPDTNIGFSVKEAGKVTLEIYNSRGQLVKTLVNGVIESGDQIVTWNGTNDSSKTVASGVYFYKMKTENFISTKKMILMK